MWLKLSFLVFIFIFGCIQETISQEFFYEGKNVAELSASGIPFVCSVNLNDEKGDYIGNLSIKNQSYRFEFRLKGKSTELVKLNGKYYQRKNNNWFMFSNNSFELAKTAGAVDPSIVTNLIPSNINCLAGDAFIPIPTNYTDYDLLLYSMRSNETNYIESLKLDCDLFTFYNCSEFEEGDLTKACDYCKR